LVLAHEDKEGEAEKVIGVQRDNDTMGVKVSPACPFGDIADEPELVSRYEQMVASLDGEQIRRLAQRLTKTDPISVTVKH